jgi:hypothetical protein
MQQLQLNWAYNSTVNFPLAAISGAGSLKPPKSSSERFFPRGGVSE